MNFNGKSIKMDPNILLGIANEQLRHECDSLESLAAAMDVDPSKIEDRLAEIYFHYEIGLNQFKPDLD